MFSRPTALFLAGLAVSACSAEESSSPGDSTTTITSAPQSFEACDVEFSFAEPDPNLVWTPNAIKLVSKQLSPRVFAIYDENVDKSAPAGIPLATSGGFVVGDDGVLLVESMLNRQLFCQVVNLVQAETKKPIRYVVNTSAHGDHCYGNMFLPSDVEIVQHERTATYIAEYFEEDLAFMKTNFGGDSQGLAEIQPTPANILVTDAKPWSIDLGGVTVEAKYYGFAQTGGDLFVHVPDAKVVWTGNAVVAEEPAIPWLLAGHAEETGVTLSALKAALPAGTLVVPGHGRVMETGGLDFSINYLETMVSEVNTAVDNGLSEEETVSAVAMEPFQGYALWGWIHTTVNVPATYKEMKK